jgi:hypothetical protein
MTLLVELTAAELAFVEKHRVSADHVYDGQVCRGSKAAPKRETPAVFWSSVQPVAKAVIACSRAPAAASSATPQASLISSGSKLPDTCISPARSKRSC